jgi:hypothetical protein
MARKPTNVTVVLKPKDDPMTNALARLAVTVALPAMILSAAPAAAQDSDLDPSRRPSPVGIARTFLADTYVKVTYGRPYMRDRAIFGDPADGATYLVPFGQVWRTGANEATEITITGPVQFAGQRLETGTYSVFTVPGEESWEVHIYPELGMDGTGQLGPGFTIIETYDPSLDVLVAEVPTATLDEPVEQFTIAFEDADEGAHMVLRWETTEVRVPIERAAG